VYLLGLYLGDGTISSHPRDVFFEVYAYSRAWPCLFPQHGSGPKHKRRIWLAGWQQELAQRWPEDLIRGMIQSDGFRFINTGRGGWRHARYGFSNASTDIHQHLLHGV
jgi:hypothetical protein